MEIAVTPPVPEAVAKSAAGTPRGGMAGIARQTGLYGIGMIFGKSLSFLMLPVYTRFLTPADYGVMELVSMTVDVVMIIAGAQLVDGMYRFYHKAETDEERARVVATALFLLTSTFSLLGITTLGFAPWLSRLIFRTDAHADIIRLAAATVAITPLLMVPLAYYRMKDRAGIFVFSNLAKLGLGAAMNVVLLLLGWGVTALFVSTLVTTTLIGFSLTAGVLRDVGVRPSLQASRDLIRFGLPLIATNIATFLFTFGDRYFLQNAGDAEIVGLYMFAYQFGFLLMSVGYGPFMNVWQPRRFEISKREDRDELYARGFIYVNVMLLAIAAGMVLFIGDFFRIMTTPAFYDASRYVPVILVGYVLQGWANVQDIGILVSERTQYLTYANWIAAAVAVVGYAILVPRYLAWGAAWTTLLTFLVRYALIFGWSQRFWPVRYNWTPVLKLAILATIVGIVGILLPTMPLLASLGVRGVLFAVFLVAIWMSGALDGEDRRALQSRFRGVLEGFSHALRRRGGTGASRS